MRTSKSVARLVLCHIRARESVVIPANAGIQSCALDSRVRGNDGASESSTSTSTTFQNLLALLLVLLGCNGSLVLADDATLNWENGDSLTGELVAVDETILVWRSPVFAEPLQIKRDAISQIRMPALEGQSNHSADQFRIVMRNGDVLTGTLNGIDDSSLSFTSARFGDFDVVRDQVISLQQSAGTGGLIFSGPRGLTGWQPALRRSANAVNRAGMMMAMPMQAREVEKNGADDKPTAWTEEADGSLKTTKSGAAIFLPLDLPEQFEVEVLLATEQRFGFTLAVGRDARDGLRLETWINVLVAANDSKFSSLQTIADGMKQMHLHLFVDYARHRVSVYERSGQKLGEISANGLRGGAEGLLFRNGDYDMSIQRLVVSRWDGREPQLASDNGAMARTKDGVVHAGTISGYEAATGLLSLQREDETKQLTISEVDSLLMASRLTIPAVERGPIQIAWHDGTVASGKLINISDQRVTMELPNCSRPLTFPLAGVERIGLAPPAAEAQAEKDPDRMFHAAGSLSGRLLVDGEAEAPVQWSPQGGLNSVPLKGGGDARFLRSAAVKHLTDDADLRAKFPDVITLKAGDVLPCQIKFVTAETVELSLPFCDATSLPVASVRAIELAAASRIHQSGFGDDGWQGRDRKVKEDYESVSLRAANQLLQHPGILTGDTVRFHLKWPKQSYGSLTMSLFGSVKDPKQRGTLSKLLGQGRGPDMPLASDPVSDATSFSFVLLPGQLQVDDKPRNQQQQMMMWGGFNQQRSESVTMTPDCEADVTLVTRDGTLSVLVNDQPIKTIPLNPKSQRTRSLSFRGSIDSREQVVRNGQVQNQAAEHITLSAFEVDTTAGASASLFIEQESREAAMQVPRFRRDNPATHVLLAPNGDVLRGKLTNMTEQHVVFESRLESLRLDRSRVAALLWLDPLPKQTSPNESGADEPDRKVPAEDESGFVLNDEQAASRETDMLAELSDGFRISMTPQRLREGRMLGQSQTLGLCSFPAASIRQLFVGDPEGRSTQAAWDQWVSKHAPEPDWDIPASDGGNSAGSALIGKPAPDIELSLLSGGTFKLSEQRGKIVVLDFWATWCGPCVAAMPDYIAATSAFDRSQVELIAVNQQEASDRIREFLTEQNLSPTVVLDRDGTAGAAYSVSGIPHMVIIGADGTVEDVHVGYQAGSGERLQESLQQMIDGTWKRPAAGEQKVEPGNQPAI